MRTGLKNEGNILVFLTFDSKYLSKMCEKPRRQVKEEKSSRNHKGNVAYLLGRGSHDLHEIGQVWSQHFPNFRQSSQPVKVFPHPAQQRISLGNIHGDRVNQRVKRRA